MAVLIHSVALALLAAAAADQGRIQTTCDTEAACQDVLPRAEDGDSADVELLQRHAMAGRRGLVEVNASKGNSTKEGYRARRARLCLLSKASQEEDPENSGDQEFAWDQVTQAVQIENLTGQLSAAKAQAAEVKAELQSQLDELIKECPYAEQIKRGLSDNWEELRQAVVTESLRADMEEAKEVGSQEYQKLKEEYDEMTRDFDLKDVKERFYHQWDLIAQSIPGLDELRQAWDHAWDATRRAAHKAWDTVSGWWR
mmetsp:Transcript_114423/g.334534  ORF Transcript_114423/g.334534 Transcript_114423/m.334534 type:complete len:256 (+) Transcript_114423:54-821(+)